MNAVTGLLLLALLGAEGTPSKNEPTPPEQWELTLSEAIRIGLGNSESMHVVCERVEEDDQVYVTIAPLDRAGSPWRFKAETMASVRSIEQLYWTLAQHRAQVAASEQAVKTGRAILKREQAEAEVTVHGALADIAEAEQRLEQFQADLAAKRTDIATTERQLRKVMGVRSPDNRQIVPVTPPVEAERKPDWNVCLAAMMTNQPDLAQQRRMVSAVGIQYLVARGPAVLLSNLGLGTDDNAVTSDAEPACSALRKEQASLERLLHRTTHDLARFFVEVDANYKQFRAASRVRTAAIHRLEALGTYYEEGRVPIERYLDAVSQHASAIAQEARFKMAYNISLVALEEVKGTLLAHRQVTVEETAPAAAPQTQVVSSPAPRTIDAEVAQASAETVGAPAPARNVTFDITIGETRPIRVRGTISIAPGK